MGGDLDILLTNDDGIDAPGLRAMYDVLDGIGTVTVVAPETNQSAVGRSLTYGRLDDDDAVETIDLGAGKFSCTVPHADHELGYAIRGTPCDCVIVGVNALDPTPDVVVSGCNPGANVGAHVLTRSGTVSAAYEAACLGVPSMAVSMDKVGFDATMDSGRFARPAALAADLLEHSFATGVFDRIDYLNVNTPRPDREPAALELTRPTLSYEMDASLQDGRFRMTNAFWKRLSEGDPPDEPGTDRRALYEGNASISPLVLPFTMRSNPALDGFVTDFEPAP